MHIKAHQNSMALWPLWAALLLASMVTPTPLHAAVDYPANPVALANSVYLAQKGLLRFDVNGLDVNELRLVWQALPDYRSDAPVVTAQTVLAGGSAGLVAVSREHGTVLWRLASKARLFSPTIAAGVVYVGGEDGSLRALNESSGQLHWQREFDGWVYAPAVIDKRLIIAGQEHVVRGLKTADGELLWQFALDQEAVFRPIAVQDSVVVTTYSGAVLALATSDGSLRWRKRGKTPYNSPVVVGNTLVFRTFAGPLIALSADSGQQLWQSQQRLSAQPLCVSDGRVVAVSDSGDVVVLDAASGSIQRRYPSRGQVIASPAVVGQRLVLFTDAGVTKRWPRLSVFPWVSTSFEEVK